MRFNEYYLTGAILLLSILTVLGLNAALPQVNDTMNYLEAVGDNLGLRLIALAIFDVHTAALLYFVVSREYKTLPTLLRTQNGAIGFGLIVAAWLVGSALVFLK